MLEQHRDWVRPEQDRTRQEVVRLLEESRYGIHGMVGEHFGMAVAEMQRAGCIVFVPHVGGPVEIVGHEPRVCYSSIKEAVSKIDAVLRNPGIQAELYHHALRQRELFTTERFVREIRESVRQFVHTPANASDISSPVSPGYRFSGLLLENDSDACFSLSPTGARGWHMFQGISARWVFHSFGGLHLLIIPGQWPVVLNLTEDHQHLLRLLGQPYMRLYGVKYS